MKKRVTISVADRERQRRLPFFFPTQRLAPALLETRTKGYPLKSLERKTRYESENCSNFAVHSKYNHMNEFHIYLRLAPYLAQWYIYRCAEHAFLNGNATFPNGFVSDGINTPVKPIKNSPESKALQRALSINFAGRPDPIPEGANLCLIIPSYEDKDPRTYNYLGQHGRNHLVKVIRQGFEETLWTELHDARPYLGGMDDLIFQWMETNHIEINETNWCAISKCYQRMRDAYNHRKMRKKRTGLPKKYK